MTTGTKVNWFDYFYLDATSPTGIRWKVFNRAINPRSQRFPGDVAGFKKRLAGGGFEYYRVKLCGKNHAVHRIVWEMTFGEIPEGFVVNHKDCDTFNNDVDNLELCTQKVNMRRRKDHTGNGISKANTSGVTGVTFSVTCNKTKTRCLPYWVAYIMLPTGKQLKKSFRQDILGDDVAFKMAVDWRAKMLDELRALNIGYI